MAVARSLSWLSFVSSLCTAWVWSVPLPPVTLATAAPTAADQQGEFCSPTLCGGVNFSFPFGIVPDHATETNCGVPRFLVLCSNNTPYFGSSPYSFRILDIFYDNSSLLIADVRKLEGFHSSASKPCRSPTNNSSNKVGLPFSISPANQNMIFYDCVEPPAQAVRKSRGLVNTVCGNKTLVGVTKGPDVPGIYFLEGCNATVVPMLARSGEGEVNPANYMEIISDGFLLTWQRSPSPSPLSSPAGACGGLNITYPFWLEEPGRQPCGPPSFQLKCNSNRAFLTKSVYQAYEVLSIFTKNNSFHMVDHNLPLATSCPAPTVNISLFSPGTFVLSKTNKELLFLGKCTGFPPADSAGFHSLPCDNSSFVRLGDGRNFSSHGIQGGIPPDCLFSVVPFFGSPDGNGDDYVGSMRNELHSGKRCQTVAPSAWHGAGNAGTTATPAMSSPVIAPVTSAVS